ncbi:unnamed protein product [Arabidopsis halleri]
MDSSLNKNSKPSLLVVFNFLNNHVDLKNTRICITNNEKCEIK